MRVTLDKKALLALASDTRLDIMRKLQPMRRTVTQVAEALDIDKGGVHRHLQKLVQGDLVTRHDDHGFIYYGLTWKGRDLLNPNENTKIVLLLGLSAVLILGAVMATLAALTAVPGPATAEETLGTEPGSEPGAVEPGTAAWNPVLLLLGLLLVPAAVVVLITATQRLWRPKQRPAPAVDAVA